MSHFTPAEIEYLKSQRLGRLATVNSKGEPHVVPVSFRYNAELDTIDTANRCTILIGSDGIALNRCAGNARTVKCDLDGVPCDHISLAW